MTEQTNSREISYGPKAGEKFDKNRGQIRGIILTALPRQAIILTNASADQCSELKLFAKPVKPCTAEPIQFAAYRTVP